MMFMPWKLVETVAEWGNTIFLEEDPSPPVPEKHSTGVFQQNAFDKIQCQRLN